MEQRISILTLGVKDLARSRQFYADGLGWKPVYEDKQIVFFQAGGMIFGLFLAAELAKDFNADPASFGRAPIAMGYNVHTKDEVDPLIDEADGVRDHAIADDAKFVFAEDARRHEMQDVFLSADENGVPGVVAAGVADDDVRIFGEHVNDFALAFVAPLGADENRVCHKFFRNPRLMFAIKIPEREFGAKRVSLRWEARSKGGRCQFRKVNQDDGWCKETCVKRRAGVSRF